MSGRRKSWNKMPRKAIHKGGVGVIYCDEAGFTGNNLLDKDQEIFAYVGLAISPKRASELVHEILRDCRLQPQELKGSRLLKIDLGRAVITRLLKVCVPDARIVFHWKTYALACKFFEYIFEPPLANQNSICYSAGFHRFISALLFMCFRAKDRAASDLFQDFATWVREGNPATLERFLPSGNGIARRDENPLQAISAFALMHRDAIRRELEHYHQNPTTPNWILDLSSTSIFSVLCSFGEVYDQLDVYVDRSKPLETETSIMEAMVNRTEKARIRLFGKERPYSFNLVKLPTFVSSRDYAGIQLADIVAAAIAHAVQRRFKGEKDPEEWLSIARPAVLGDCILPESKPPQADSLEGFVGIGILNELVERSVRQVDLFAGMPEYIAGLHHAYPRYQASTQKKLPPNSPSVS